RGIIPLARAAGREKLRNFFAVQVFVNGRVGWCPERLEDQENAVLFDELANLLHRLGRAIRVVDADEVDLSAVDSPFAVDLLEEGSLELSDGPVGRCRPAIGHGLPDLDFGGIRPGVGAGASGVVIVALAGT